MDIFPFVIKRVLIDSEEKTPVFTKSKFVDKTVVFTLAMTAVLKNVRLLALRVEILAFTAIRFVVDKVEIVAKNAKIDDTTYVPDVIVDTVPVFANKVPVECVFVFSVPPVRVRAFAVVAVRVPTAKEPELIVLSAAVVAV